MASEHPPVGGPCMSVRLILVGIAQRSKRWRRMERKVHLQQEVQVQVQLRCR